MLSPLCKKGTHFLCMKIDRQHSVAFSGYRASKMARTLDGADALRVLDERIYDAIMSLAEQGYTIFLTGMSDGFDLLAASAVLRLKEFKPEIELVAVVPFHGQSSSYSEQDKELYARVLAGADITLYLSYKYISPKQFLCRNDFLVLNSSKLLCYYDGQRGGTMYTYNRAVKFGLGIVNLAR